MAAVVDFFWLVSKVTLLAVIVMVFTFGPVFCFHWIKDVIWSMRLVRRFHRWRYPPVVVDGYPAHISGLDLSKIAARLHKEGFKGGSMTNSFFIRGTRYYTLQEVPIPNEIGARRRFESHELGESQVMLHWPTVGKYSRLQTPYPPLILMPNGFLLKGKHRLYAAKKRGDKTISVYVPEGFSGEVRL